MIDVLLAAEIDGEKLPFQDVVASAMSFAFHYVATYPDERDRLIAEPETMPKAVEEFIRFAGSIHGIPRTVAKDVELSGHTFCRGESVLVNYASANRDAAEFPDPGSARVLIAKRIGTSDSAPASIDASAPIWHVWSSPSVSSRSCRGWEASLSHPVMVRCSTGTP